MCIASSIPFTYWDWYFFVLPIGAQFRDPRQELTWSRESLESHCSRFIWRNCYYFFFDFYSNCLISVHSSFWAELFSTLQLVCVKTAFYDVFTWSSVFHLKYKYTTTNVKYMYIYAPSTSLVLIHHDFDRFRNKLIFCLILLVQFLLSSAWH